MTNWHGSYDELALVLCVHLFVLAEVILTRTIEEGVHNENFEIK